MMMACHYSTRAEEYAYDGIEPRRESRLPATAVTGILRRWLWVTGRRLNTETDSGCRSDGRITKKDALLIVHNGISPRELGVRWFTERDPEGTVHEPLAGARRRFERLHGYASDSATAYMASQSSRTWPEITSRNGNRCYVIDGRHIPKGKTDRFHSDRYEQIW